MDIELIIAGGCSITFGSELIGDEFVEGYSSHLGENNELFSKYIEKTNTFSRPEWLDYKEKSNEKTWANKLAKKLSVDISNVGLPGACNEELLFYIREEFEKKIESIDPKKILVIAMITTKFRISDFDVRELRKFIRIDYKEAVKKYREKDFLWKSFSQISSTRSYIESFGSKMIVLNSCLWDCFNNKNINDMVNVLYNFSHFNNEELLPGRHFRENAHTLLAEKLYEDLK